MSGPGKKDGTSDLDLPAVADDFDPGLDWPPDGALVVTAWGSATFCEEPILGWHFDDGRYARPFDSLGQLLARAWAANPRINHFAVNEES